VAKMLDILNLFCKKPANGTLGGNKIIRTLYIVPMLNVCKVYFIASLKEQLALTQVSLLCDFDVTKSRSIY